MRACYCGGAPPTHAATTTWHLAVHRLCHFNRRQPFLGLCGLLRTFVGQLLRAKSRKVPLPEARGKNVQQRARRIASGGGGFLGRGKWEARRRYFCGSGRDAAADGGGGLLADEANFAEQYKEAQIGEGGDPLSDMNPMVSSIQAHYFTQRLLLLHNPI